MSAFTDRLHALLSRFTEVSKEDIAKLEAELEAKIHPFVTDVRNDFQAELTTVEQQLKAQIAALEAKVETFLNGSTPQTPAGS